MRSVSFLGGFLRRSSFIALVGVALLASSAAEAGWLTALGKLAREAGETGVKSSDEAADAVGSARRAVDDEAAEGGGASTLETLGGVAIDQAAGAAVDAADGAAHVGAATSDDDALPSDPILGLALTVFINLGAGLLYCRSAWWLWSKIWPAPPGSGRLNRLTNGVFFGAIWSFFGLFWLLFGLIWSTLTPLIALAAWLLRRIGVMPRRRRSGALRAEG